MTGFVQIIEFKTSRFDEVKALAEEYDLTSQSDNQARRVTLTEDRDRPGTYLNIVEFDSYESAMENSNRPETAQFSEQMMKLCDGPPTFYNLDVRLVPEIS
jgi:quinol monooxygenase YgiN